MVRWIIFFAVYILIDIYAFQALQTLTRSSWMYWVYWIVSALVLGNFTWQIIINGDPNHRVLTPQKSYALGFLITLLLPKLVLITILFTEDIVRVPQGIYSFFTEGRREKAFLPSRRKFISTVALSLAAIPFTSLLYGMYRGKYNYRVLNHTLEFDDLPDAFDGYTITQLSDIHSGSFDNKEKVDYGVKLANAQNSDLIVFTGDLVNNRSDEMMPWKEVFARLEAKDGKYSILGNHDYGDYVSWESEKAKEDNLDHLKDIHKEIGFKLLLNEHVYLEKDGEKIALLGVENWGKGGFKKAGDIDKAVTGVDKGLFKVVLSHDPSYWDEKLGNDDNFYHLTLSGHTHGMQFGIEIPGWVKWSPVKWRYKHWAGIYENAGRFLNVNRGFGYLAYPGRVGIWPEITVITLKKSSVA